jgi:uncharacterized membrane protein
MTMDQEAKRKLNNSDPTVTSSEHMRRRRHVIKSFEREAREARSMIDAFADSVTHFFGSGTCIALHVVFFFGWVAANTGMVAGITPFDPFPFTFLTMIVSLEAIFLSTFVLMNQNRQSRVDELREEVDLNVNLIAEAEVTKTLKLLARLCQHMGISTENDPELHQMMQPLRSEEIEAELKSQVGQMKKDHEAKRSQK